MLHWHKCFSCEEPLTCVCEDRRQTDRLTGKERKIFCRSCGDLRKKLRLAYEGEAMKLERVQLRPELETLPSRMLALPIDERGYVVPWFVDWIEGKPEFRAMDPQKWIKAIQEKRCWVCGDRLGRWMTFVAGPMCGINRTSSEPPCHLECARWSSRNCPFLNNSQAIRRQDEDFNSASKSIGGIALQRNPGVTMLWTCKDYSIFDDHKGGRLIHMGEPETVEWYAEGRLATREQVLASIDSGFPALAEMALKQEGAMQYLTECRQRFEKFIPA